MHAYQQAQSTDLQGLELEEKASSGYEHVVCEQGRVFQGKGNTSSWKVCLTDFRHLQSKGRIGHLHTWVHLSRGSDFPAELYRGLTPYLRTHCTPLPPDTLPQEPVLPIKSLSPESFCKHANKLFPL